MKNARALQCPAPSFVLALGLLLSLALSSATGCRADDEIKRGALGEYCNGRDTDCRVGLFCEEGRCQATGDDICGAVCEKLDDACAVETTNCRATCGLTIEGWSERAQDAFATCIGELTCAEAADDAPNLCYNRIAIPEGRTERCDDLASAARSCSDAETADRIRRGCYAFARVRSESEWTAVGCDEALEAGMCAALGACLDDAFAFDPPVSLGDATFTLD